MMWGFIQYVKNCPMSILEEYRNPFSVIWQVIWHNEFYLKNDSNYNNIKGSYVEDY